MTGKGGASRPACAACKHQRRKCTADCPLAPYFPADQPMQFQNAHRLFGVSNILRILKDLDPVQKAEAMKSILYEANVRQHYPVLGCLGLTFNLHFKICEMQAELDSINKQIAIYRNHHQYYQFSTHLQLAPSSSSTSQSPLVPVIGNLNMGISSSSASSQSPLVPVIDNLNMGISVADATNYDDNVEIKFADPVWANQMYMNNVTAENSVTAAAATLPFEAANEAANEVVEQECNVEQECDEISPYFDTIDEDRAYESRHVGGRGGKAKSVALAVETARTKRSRALRKWLRCLVLEDGVVKSNGGGDCRKEWTDDGGGNGAGGSEQRRRRRRRSSDSSKASQYRCMEKDLKSAAACLALTGVAN